jgi:hypothetical protein
VIFQCFLLALSLLDHGFLCAIPFGFSFFQKKNNLFGGGEIRLGYEMRNKKKL